MSMVQRVKELPDIHFENPATANLHGLLPKAVQRLVRRPPGPEAVRAGVEVLLIDRLQHHDDRPLKHLAFKRRNPDRPGVATRVASRTFASTSGVKIVPSFTVSAITTRDEPPNILENLSVAWM